MVADPFFHVCLHNVSGDSVLSPRKLRADVNLCIVIIRVSAESLVVFIHHNVTGGRIAPISRLIRIDFTLSVFLGQRGSTLPSD